MAKKLTSNIYVGADNRLLMIRDFRDVADAEIEDLFPTDLLAKAVARYLRGKTDAEEEFDEVVEDSRPLVPQVVQYAKRHAIEPDLGWKVEVAKAVKGRLLRNPDSMKSKEGLVDTWNELFDRLQPD